MKIHLPKELEQGIKSIVSSGAYASENEAVAEAVRSFLIQRSPSRAGTADSASIGAMCEDAELLGQITEEIMEARRTRTLRRALDE